MCLQRANLVKSAGEADTYLVNDLADPLQRSLHSLDLMDVPPQQPPRLPAPASPAPQPTSASCKHLLLALQMISYLPQAN